MQTDALPLSRRVQLAVVAHIRHAYTNYDRLLKEVPWQAARSLVETKTLEKLAEWRGEHDEDPNALEDILREVIVISEDEDGDEQSAAAKHVVEDDDIVEIVDHDTGSQPIRVQPIDYGNLEQRQRAPTPFSEDEERVAFIGYGQYSIRYRDPERAQREGARRRQAWDEARSRTYRSFPTRRQALGHGEEYAAQTGHSAFNTQPETSYHRETILSDSSRPRMISLHSEGTMVGRQLVPSDNVRDPQQRVSLSSCSTTLLPWPC